jgi:hypothetical protein
VKLTGMGLGIVIELLLRDMVELCNLQSRFRASSIVVGRRSSDDSED